MSYTLTVVVNSADIPILKAAGYKLCLAKKVNNSFNVIWQGGNFLYRNTFTWSAKYQVFGSNDYTNGALVEAATETVNIQYGQTATLDNNGIMHNPGGTPDNSGTFHVSNKYGAINFGVNGLLNSKYCPIYVTPSQLVSGPVDFTPNEEVLVWFDTKLTTGAMIAESITGSINVDFTQITSRSVTYASDPSNPGRGGWTLDGQLALPRTYSPLTNRFTIDKPQPGLLAKMARIISTSQSESAIVKASVTFEPGAALRFAEYLRDAQPEWAVTNTDSSVEARIGSAEQSLDWADAIRGCENAFLKTYRGFAGEPYKKLTFEVLNGQGDEPVGPPVVLGASADVSTGKAVFRFSNIPDAQQFATNTGNFKQDGVTLVGALRGVAVIVTASFDNATTNPQSDRAKVLATLSLWLQKWESTNKSMSMVFQGPIIWNKDI
ncbi:hypothetical protein C2E23DRAFT_886576 [Lenzites betulinus]|nr:hypothetical protein C2E23DRAFT_886576 [Lenzites betulinus]